MADRGSRLGIQLTDPGQLSPLKVHSWLPGWRGAYSTQTRSLNRVPRPPPASSSAADIRLAFASGLQRPVRSDSIPVTAMTQSNIMQT